MEKNINAKEYFEKKAVELYQESEKEDEDYAAALKRFELKYKNGKELTATDVTEVLDQMKKLHDSVETHKEAVIAEHKANSFK